MVRRLLPLLLIVLVPALAFAASEEKENHPDGTLHFRVPLNAKGQRHGTYQAFFPGGKKLEERVRYENGERTGTRELFDDKGKPLAEETWVHGKLVCPKSVRQIDAARAQILRDTTASVLKLPKSANPHAPPPDAMARALARVNTYRYVTDLPADVALDDGYVNLCQYAAELLAKVGKLDHHPARPAGVDDTAFSLGSDGCGHSNIYMGGEWTGSVDAYARDSDAGNIDRLGHRRWVLNPRMGKTGFGASGRFSAMYSFDTSRQSPPEYEFVCYPPRGYCPISLFGQDWAWHVSMNPAKYKVGDKAELTIYPADVRLTRGEKLPLEAQHVDREGFGIDNAIIARPKGFVLRPNTLYEVVVTGVTTTDGKPAEIGYFVSFY